MKYVFPRMNECYKYLMNECWMLIYDEKHIFSHKFIYFQVHALSMGNWEWCEGGEGPYEFPPSRGWPCLVENIKLFSKQRESQ